jgi:hypothetical protein
MTRLSLAALAIALLALACRPGGGDLTGVPLYPNAATVRLPHNQVAQVIGPIAKVDDQEVGDQGGVFDLLPGCHIVELDRQMPASSYGVSNAVYFSGQLRAVTFALRMKAGARYVIRRDMVSTGSSMTGRVVLSAREEDANGGATDLEPVKTLDDIAACKDWQRTALGK